MPRWDQEYDDNPRWDQWDDAEVQERRGRLSRHRCFVCKGRLDVDFRDPDACQCEMEGGKGDE